MFSVLMSVYNGEKVEYFIQAMESVLNQSLKAPEIVLVRDGPVYKELQDTIDAFVSANSEIVYCPLEKNVGLGNALSYGVLQARNELIFRMDTDDIACLDRFEKQFNYFVDHPEVDVVGGQICEFIDSPNNIVSRRIVPLASNDINCFLKTRNPFNHMTVAFRKNKVIACGNYKDFHYLEDYFLWCRMFIGHATFSNMNDVLVYARIGEDMYKRRGGMKYFKSWKKLEKFKLKNHITSRFLYYKTLLMRFVVQVLMPNKIRGKLLKKYSRDNSKKIKQN